MWYLLFFVAILSNIFYNLEWTRISKRTNRIIYETQPNSSNIFLRYFIINAVFILFSPLWLCYFFDLALGDVFKLEREKLMTKQVRTCAHVHMCIVTYHTEILKMSLCNFL